MYSICPKDRRFRFCEVKGFMCVNFFFRSSCIILRASVFGFLMLKLPVVSRHVDLVTGTTPQVLEGVLLYSGTDLSSFPIAEFGFVVNRVTVNWCVVGGVRAQLHR